MSTDSTAAAAATTTAATQQSSDKRPISIFNLSADFFDLCRLLPPGKHSPTPSLQIQPPLFNKEDEQTLTPFNEEETDDMNYNNNMNMMASNKNRLSCNTCKAEFESLLDQRSHFKSDLHRFNVKLNLAGKDILKEDDLDELYSDSFLKDFDVSSISGSEDEDDKASNPLNSMNESLVQSAKQKIFVRLRSGENVSVWKSLLLKDSETVACENDEFVVIDDNGDVPCLREIDVVEKLKALTHEPRDSIHFRVVLLASGGHFAGCVFDGNTVVAHKTFHRYVVRAKAGKRQSTKDASGKSIHSAGASIRRYNEQALKKNIQELLASWKPYFDASSCVFIYAPSNNRQLFHGGDYSVFSNQRCAVKNIPFSIRRPTYKEARRIYSQLSQVAFEMDQEEFPDISQLELSGTCVSNTNSEEKSIKDEEKTKDGDETFGSMKITDVQSSSDKKDEELNIISTPLHVAAKSGNIEKVLELLEQGFDPTVKDERGKTPYMLASEKEVRNTFRRFMASNLEMWDWHAADVPSPLTREMEESQAAKQAEKDAKRKARAKELKKLRREREKKAQAKAAESQNVSSASQTKAAASPSGVRPVQSAPVARLSKEEELKRKQVEEREMRAAAAERRMAMAAAAASTQGAKPSVTPSTSEPRSGSGVDIVCSCCNASLAGKIPFHRYNYKYCSTTCMNVHRQFLEDQ